MKKGGRPTKLTNSTIHKLKEAFKIDCTVLEACCYANISKSTYYKWTSQNNEFSDEIEVSKKYLELKSRQVIAKSIEGGDNKTAMWYLERKRKSEFNINSIKDEVIEEDENPLGSLLELLRLKDIEKQKGS